MRRQLSDSAVISTGSPARVYCHVTSCSRVGPPRTLTLSGLRLTKRGTGRPLTGPLAILPAACAEMTDAVTITTVTKTEWNHAAVCERCIELFTLRMAALLSCLGLLLEGPRS